MMPSLVWPGVMTPGQFGPIIRVLRSFRNAPSRTSSMIEMPSVMQTTSGIPAAAASITPSAAKAPGTNTQLAFAPVFSTASSQVLKMGTLTPFFDSQNVPPLPGVTPATTCVPYSSIPLPCTVPASPVRPWTRTFVFLSTMMLIFSSQSFVLSLQSSGSQSFDEGLGTQNSSLSQAGGLDDFPRPVGHVGGGRDLQAALREDVAAHLDVRSLEADD